MLILLIKLLFAVLVLLAVPGFFLSKAIVAKKWKKISAIEKLVIVFAVSVAVVDFLAIAMDLAGIALSRASLLAGIAFVSMAGLYVAHKRSNNSQENGAGDVRQGSFESLKNMSYRQILLFVAILVLVLSVRGLYVSRGIMPQTTDLGHHMYWSKVIADTGTLPDYGMPDFIIGEHILFGAAALISGIPIVSAMPVSLLLLVNIISLFALTILAYRISENFTSKLNAKKVAMLTFIIAGAFYAISSPQAKFVSGGVIGNVFGNLFIPLSMYCFVMALKYKSKEFAMLFLVSCATLAYTHHLSMFIFLYVFAGFVAAALAALFFFYQANVANVFAAVALLARPFFSGRNLILLLLIIIFAFFIIPPSYLNPSAIDTAVGVPVKETRTGLALGSVILSAGPWRFFYAAVGLAALLAVTFLALVKKNKQENNLSLIITIALAVMWMVMIFLMSTMPALLRVDIPSNRIVSYIAFPASILSAIGAVLALSFAEKRTSKFFFTLLFLVVLGTGFVSGFSDISDSARDAEGSNEQAVMQTYLAAQYLDPLLQEGDMVLKDHVYLPGDTWIKLFFMKDYKFPLSRAILKRYDDPTSSRETCTRDMIAMPDSQIGRECFEQTRVKYIILKNGYENAQFDRAQEFSRIYASDDAVIYMRNEHQGSAF